VIYAPSQTKTACVILELRSWSQCGALPAGCAPMAEAGRLAAHPHATCARL